MLIHAAQALGCTPWELETRPLYWREYALAYRAVTEGIHWERQAALAGAKMR